MFSDDRDIPMAQAASAVTSTGSALAVGTPRWKCWDGNLRGCSNLQTVRVRISQCMYTNICILYIYIYMLLFIYYIYRSYQNDIMSIPPFCHFTGSSHDLKEEWLVRDGNFSCIERAHRRCDQDQVVGRPVHVHFTPPFGFPDSTNINKYLCQLLTHRIHVWYIC